MTTRFCEAFFDWNNISKKGDLIMYRKMFLGMAGLALMGALFVPKVRADEWNKRTTVTVDQPIQVPGMVLPGVCQEF